MKQRSKVRGERAKSQSREAIKRKRNRASDKAPGSASPHASAGSDQGLTSAKLGANRLGYSTRRAAGKK
jgi:hypothetical protein